MWRKKERTNNNILKKIKITLCRKGEKSWKKNCIAIKKLDWQSEDITRYIRLIEHVLFLCHSLPSYLPAYAHDFFSLTISFLRSFFSPQPTRSLSLSLSLSNSLPLSLFLSLDLLLSLSLSLSLSLFHSLSPSLPLSLNFTCFLPPSLSLNLFIRVRCSIHLTFLFSISLPPSSLYFSNLSY